MERRAVLIIHVLSLISWASNGLCVEGNNVVGQVKSSDTENFLYTAKADIGDPVHENSNLRNKVRKIIQTGTLIGVSYNYVIFGLCAAFFFIVLGLSLSDTTVLVFVGLGFIFLGLMLAFIPPFVHIVVHRESLYWNTL